MIKLTQQQKNSIINTMWKNKINIKDKNKQLYGYWFKGFINELNINKYDIRVKWTSEYNNVNHTINFETTIDYEFKGDIYTSDDFKIYDQELASIDDGTFKHIMEPILDLVIAKMNIQELRN